MANERNTLAEDLPLLRSTSVKTVADGETLATPAPAKFSPFVVVVSLAAAISGLCFGFEIGIIDTVLAMPSFRTYFGTYTTDASGGEVPAPDKDHVEGWIVSMFLIGAMIGSMVVSWMVDAWGRRWSLLVGSAVFCAGGTLQALSTDLLMLYGGRLASGAAIGILSMCAPLYVSESAPAHMRGRLVACVQLLITVGILAASAVNAALYKAASGDSQWRGALAAQVVPGIALAGLLLCMPESPRWLVSMSRHDAARAVLVKLRGTQDVDGELGSMAKQAHDEAEEGGDSGSPGTAKGGSWFSRTVVRPWAPLLSGSGLRRLGIACALQLFQQATGINVILYYGQRLFNELGVPKEHAATTLVAANAALLVIGTIPGILLVDNTKVGRRRLLLGGAAAMALFHACVAVAILAVGPIGDGQASPANVAAGWFAVASMLAFTVAFSATWGPCVWVVQSEIFPTHAERGKGGAVATLTNWTSNAVIGKVAPLVLSAVGPWTYAGFSVMCGVMMGFTWVAVPETGGRSLEAMGDILT